MKKFLKSYFLFIRKLLFISILSFVLASVVNAAQVARFAYVVNPYDYTISSFYLNKEGMMFPNGMVYTRDKFPATLIIHPNKKYLYSASRTIDTAPIYKIDPVSGRLSQSENSHFDTRLRSPFSYGFHPSGKFLYVAGRGGGVAGFKVDEKTGAMRHVKSSPFKAGERTRNLTVHPTGKFVYASNAYTNNISAYRVDQNTGSLIELKNSPFPAGEVGPFDDTFAKLPDVMDNKGGMPYYTASHPSGDYLYVTNWAAASISVFRVNQQTGDLSLIGTPMQTGLTPYAVAVHPSGKFVYATTWGGNDVWVYRVDQATGLIYSVEGSPFPVLGMKPVDIAFNEDGSQVFVANNGSNSVSIFKSNNETGALELVDFAMTRAGAVDIEIYNADKVVEIVPTISFILDKSKAQLSTYRVDPKTGSLKKLASVKTGKQPSAIAKDPLNRFVFVSNSADDAVSAFQVDHKTGKLTEVEGSPYKVGKNPQSIIVDANGWYLYTINEQSRDMSVFLIHYTKGQLAEAQGSPLSFGRTPSHISGDQTSRFIYVSSDEKKSVQVFRFRQAVTPSIFEINDNGSPFVFNAIPSSVVNDPTGRFTLVILKDSNQLLNYFVQVSTGELVTIPENPEPYKLDGKGPIQSVFHPDGKFVYVLNQESKNISQIRMERLHGEMSKVADAVKTGGSPQSMVMDPGGKFLYVINKGQKSLQRFSINSETGKLTEIEQVNLGFSPQSMVISRDFR